MQGVRADHADIPSREVIAIFRSLTGKGITTGAPMSLTAWQASITPAQCRAARALINWSKDQLEAASQVARKTIADFEREARQPYPRTLIAICTALKAAGIIFVDENGEGPGVRLRKERA
jgi:DNA-binding XRE family transcriptional regulator